MIGGTPGNVGIVTCTAISGRGDWITRIYLFQLFKTMEHLVVEMGHVELRSACSGLVCMYFLDTVVSVFLDLLFSVECIDNELSPVAKRLFI